MYKLLHEVPQRTSVLYYYSYFLSYKRIFYFKCPFFVHSTAERYLPWLTLLTETCIDLHLFVNSFPFAVSVDSQIKLTKNAFYLCFSVVNLHLTQHHA